MEVEIEGTADEASEISSILRALREPRYAIPEASKHLPAEPGLYAIYGDDSIWRKLGLGDPPDDRPLYVGKSESNLASRVISTHVGNGQTGRSTVRRSFAALLADELGLAGMPRSPAKPESFSNFGLSPEHDKILTKWMAENLHLAFWEWQNHRSLPVCEQGVLENWLPPLNISGINTSWTTMLKSARGRMAEQARRWADADFQ